MSELVERVRLRLAAGSGDPAAGIEDAVRREMGGVADDAALRRLRSGVQDELVGAGPLEVLLAQPDVTDVLVNGPDDVWIDDGSGLRRVPLTFADDAAVRRLAQRLATAGGRRLDDATPYVDAALPDGTRLHAVLPPITRHTTVSLRVLARRRYGLDDLVRAGALPPEAAELLRGIVRARLAFLVTGGTGTGKTTLLAALLTTVVPGERIVVIEDAAELAVDHPHVVGLVTRAPNVEGAGEIGLRELVRQALRMRPDRLVVGEFRGAEMVELLIALNTGHDGGAATLHANSASDVPVRLAALGALGGLGPDQVDALARSAIDVVVHLRREGPRRFVEEIAVVGNGPGEPVLTAWRATGGPAAGAAVLAAALLSRQVRPPDWLR